MEEYKQTILDYVINEYLEEDDDQEIDLDTELISGGIVDSFSMVSLKRFLEKKYDIQIPDADATPEAEDGCYGRRLALRRGRGPAQAEGRTQGRRRRGPRARETVEPTAASAAGWRTPTRTAGCRTACASPCRP